MDEYYLPAPWVRRRPLVGDASTRNYSRVWDSRGASAILAFYPEEVRWQIARDLETRAWCESRGVRVPTLLDHLPDSGLVVIEDLGAEDAEQSLRAAAKDQRAELAARLVEPLLILARLPPSDLPPWNRPLDAARLRWELAGFELWFLRHQQKSRPTAAVGTWLDDLASEIDRHPKHICHRDFHLNNLFLLASGEAGVIDFQDILVGPDTYDIVSLMHERAMPDLLDRSQCADILHRWARRGRIVDGWDFRARQVRLQRALKVLGTFARFSVAGNTTYVPWMRALARELLPDLEAAGAPPDVTDLLLD